MKLKSVVDARLGYDESVAADSGRPYAERVEAARAGCGRTGLGSASDSLQSFGFQIISNRPLAWRT